MKLFDLSDPAHPRYIRDYGVVGQEPAHRESQYQQPCTGRSDSGIVCTSAMGRALAAFCRSSIVTNSSRVIRPRLIRSALTAKNILYAQVGRLDTSPHVGAHTTFPVLGIQIPEFARTSTAKQPTSLSWSTRPFGMNAVSLGRWSSWWMSPPHQSHFLWRIFRFQRPVAISAHAVDASRAHASNDPLPLSTIGASFSSPTSTLACGPWISVIHTVHRRSPFISRQLRRRPTGVVCQSQAVGKPVRW